MQNQTLTTILARHLTAALFLCGTFIAANAATVTVTNTLDNGAGSLRNAVTTTNGTTDNDIINFNIPNDSAGCTGGACIITLTSGELIINNKSTSGELIITNSIAASRVVISGNNASRVVAVGRGANLTLDGLTVTGGNGTGTVSPELNGFGGGIIVRKGSALTLTNLTVSGNSATNGGGIYNTNTLAITNSTLSGNNSSTGGGITNFAEMTIINSTVTGNNAFSTICTQCGGGILNAGNTAASLLNTIVAENTAANTSGAPDFQGAVSSISSFNLIGNNTGTTGINDGANGNKLNVNARLAPLGNYGGGTPTHALLSNSPALNNGAAADTPIADQRGASRVGNTDIGAFELNNSAGGGNFKAILPTGKSGTLYNTMLTSFDDTRYPNFTFSVTSGILPNGIGLIQNSSLTPAAIQTVSLTGTPTQTGTFNFTVTTSDGVNTNAADYILTIAAPTAATVTISGRVLTGEGRGLRNARLTFTDSAGGSRTALTTSLGYYRFADVSAGQTVTVSIVSKKYTFAPQIINVTEEINDLNFTAQP